MYVTIVLNRNMENSSQKELPKYMADASDPLSRLISAKISGKSAVSVCINLPECLLSLFH